VMVELDSYSRVLTGWLCQLRKGKALDTIKNIKALSFKAHLTHHYKLMMVGIKAIPCPHVRRFQ